MLREQTKPGGKPSAPSALDNPFATRFVSPGQIPYFFSNPGEDRQIIKRGDATGWTGQIVGPHGSGKTTLVRHLSQHLQQRFQKIKFLIVRGVREIQICQPLENTAPSQRNERTLYVIDGIERLSWLQRKLIVADFRRKRISLIVTAHRRLLGLPVFYETSFDEMRFCNILHHLGTDQYEDQYKRLRDGFGDNCREMLFELYDYHLDGNS